MKKLYRNWNWNGYKYCIETDTQMIDVELYTNWNWNDFKYWNITATKPIKGAELRICGRSYDIYRGPFYSCTVLRVRLLTSREKRFPEYTEINSETCSRQNHTAFVNKIHQTSERFEQWKTKSFKLINIELMFIKCAFMLAKRSVFDYLSRDAVRLRCTRRSACS